MTQEEYNKEMESIAEKLAYVSFTNHGYETLEARGITEEDIKRFVVTMFFASHLDDDNLAEVELDVRFTVYVDSENGYTDREITFMFQDQVILDAIIEKIHDVDHGFTQRHEYKFGKPNPIQLFDAQLTLDEKLGIE